MSSCCHEEKLNRGHARRHGVGATITATAGRITPRAGWTFTTACSSPAVVSNLSWSRRPVLRDRYDGKHVDSCRFRSVRPSSQIHLDGKENIHGSQVGSGLLASLQWDLIRWEVISLLAASRWHQDPLMVPTPISPGAKYLRTRIPMCPAIDWNQIAKVAPTAIAHGFLTLVYKTLLNSNPRIRLMPVQ
jgi:hypothetical protein